MDDIQLLYTYHDSKRAVGVAVFNNGAKITFPELWLRKLSRAKLVKTLWNLAAGDIQAGKKM